MIYFNAKKKKSSPRIPTHSKIIECCKKRDARNCIVLPQKHLPNQPLLYPLNLNVDLEEFLYGLETK